MKQSDLVALGAQLARELRDVLGEQPSELDSATLQSLNQALTEHVRRRLLGLNLSDDDAVVVMMSALAELSRM